MWRSLDRCVEYLVKELHIDRFELCDAAQLARPIESATPRADAAAGLRHAHAAAAHDLWFRTQVEQGIAEADAENAQWLSHSEADASWAAMRAALLKLDKGSAA